MLSTSKQTTSAFVHKSAALAEGAERTIVVLVFKILLLESILPAPAVPRLETSVALLVVVSRDATALVSPPNVAILSSLLLLLFSSLLVSSSFPRFFGRWQFSVRLASNSTCQVNCDRGYTL